MHIRSTIARMLPENFRNYAEVVLTPFLPFYIVGNKRDDALMRTLVSALLDESSNAIDVGSHEGAFIDWFLRVAPLGQHGAIEPLPQFAAALRKRYPTVTVHEVAASDVNGNATFFHVASSPAYSGLKRIAYPTPQTVNSIDIKTARLDDLVPIDFPVSLIKIDVEGAELEVLRGAARTIQRWRPAILFEHGSASADPYGTTPMKLYRLITGFGLRIFSLNGDGPHCEDAFVDRCLPPGKPKEWNFLAKR